MQGDEKNGDKNNSKNQASKNEVSKKSDDADATKQKAPDLIGDDGEVSASSVDSASTEGDSCQVCRQPLSRIFLNVDGNTLIMESCDGCDMRRWQLAGQRIDLQRALEKVEEQASRARN